MTSHSLRIFFTLALCAPMLLAPCSAGCESPVKIGISAPLTGPAAAWGADIKNVLEFANEKLGEGKFSFVVEDDRCDPKTSVLIAQKLASVDKVPVVFTVCGAVTLAAGPVYERSRVVVMAPIATPSRISGLGRYIFRTGLSDKAAAGTLADFIAQRHSRVGILTEQNEYSMGFLSDFSERAGRIGLAVESEEFKSGEPELKTQLLRLHKRAPEAIFVNTNGEQPFAVAIRQMKELQFAPAIYGAYLPGSSAFLELAGPLANGIVFIDFYPADDLLNEEGRALYREYLGRFGPLKSWSFAFPAAFEAFRAVQKAIRSGQPPQEYLHTASFSGIIGTYSFNENGDIVGLAHSMRTIREGRNTSYSE